MRQHDGTLAPTSALTWLQTDPLPGVGVVGDAAYYSGRLHRLFRASGGMADALASGASVLRDVGVQVPLRPQI
jgi:hypothetical protein